MQHRYESETSTPLLTARNNAINRSAQQTVSQTQPFPFAPGYRGCSPTEMFMTENPYSTPSLELSSGSTDSLTSSPTSPALASIAKPTFLAWERLRLLFVFVLGLLTVLLVGPSLMKLSTLVLVAEGAIVANVCFFAGPIIETYVRWLGYDRKWVRWFLFVGGTILTAMLAVATMASMLLPGQN